jgi:hypothetical protein
MGQGQPRGSVLITSLTRLMVTSSRKACVVVFHVKLNVLFLLLHLKASFANSKSKKKWCQAQVAHAYNPSYSGGRDRGSHSSKPARANSS